MWRFVHSMQSGRWASIKLWIACAHCCIEHLSNLQNIKIYCCVFFLQQQLSFSTWHLPLFFRHRPRWPIATENELTMIYRDEFSWIFSRTLSTKNELLHSESTINRDRVWRMTTMTMTTRARNISAWQDWQLWTISSYRCNFISSSDENESGAVCCMLLSDDENIDMASFRAGRMKNCHNIEQDY